jgi:hypothetical protein
VICVQRLSARARLDESPAPLEHATTEAAAGDESWEQWISEYDRGDALVLRLELAIQLGNGEREVFTESRDGFFVENHLHVPKVEQQIAELAFEGLNGLAAELADRGYAIDLHELAGMYVHVELDPDVRRRVGARGSAS